MKPDSAARVILSKDTYRDVRVCVANAKNDFEVGGVLLGYKMFRQYYIVSATFPKGTEEKSAVSFTLDGDWHTARAAELTRSFRRKPLILGVWHSHICDGDTFSEQDRLSNMQFAKSFNGALSMIVMLTAPLNELRMTAYHISPKGEERLCKIEIA